MKRILVVDDEPLVCDAIRWLLMVDGHAVETALNSQAALALFQKARFDLIIVDYELPGMKGDELAAAIKQLDPHQHVAMITAYPEMLASSGKPLVGVDSVISKPFNSEQLRNILKT